MSNSIGSSINLNQAQYSPTLAQAKAPSKNNIEQNEQQGSRDTVALSSSAQSSIQEAPLPVYKNVEYAPQIKQGVSSLIDKANLLHSQGSGSLPLTEMVTALGVELTPEQMATLKARGDIKFSPTEGNSGTFSNSGKSAKVPYGDFQMKIPNNLSGEYTVTPNGLKVSFDKKNCIQAGAWGVYYNMENMAMNREQVNVDMEGKKYDQTIMLSPKPAGQK